MVVVKVKVLDTKWEEIWIFNSEKWQSLAETINQNEDIIPVSCNAWACWVCAVKVIEWMDLINKWLISEPLMEQEEDKILTCIAWVDEKVREDDSKEEKLIIVQKIF